MRIGRYQILEELGKGSMGIVYKAHDPQIDRPVALKVLRQDRVTSEDFVQRFLKEAHAIGRLSHPNIVIIYDAGNDKGTIFIAMELLSGKSLRKIMRDKQIDYQKIVRIGVQVAEALDYAHQLGIVHRDIKPSNIILTHDDYVKITDFGIAHVEDAKTPLQTRAGEILGTPIYMSPEQVMGQPVDGRSDLYSLGVILYEMFMGKNPFRGENLATIFNKIIQGAPPVPEQKDSPTGQALSTLIVKSISKEPANRFQTGKAMAEPLKACLQRRRSDRSQQPAKPIKPKHTRRYAFFAVFLVCLFSAAVYVFNPWKRTEDNQPPAIYAVLNVNSNPSGAQLFLNGTFKGKTPLAVDLPLGKYEVRLSLPEFYEWESQLQLTEEGEMPLFVRLIPMNEEISQSEEKSK